MRSYCTQCHYPTKTCLCEAIQPIAVPIKVVVLQHPDEVGHAKNTVRLMQLAMPKSLTVAVGITPEDFSDVQQQIDIDNTVVIYPSPSSQGMESDKQWKCENPDTILLLDGSWRKAFSLWQNNPWLHEIRQWHFESIPDNRYHIRKTDKENSLSTLEATAYCLQQRYHVDTAPLMSLFDHFVNQWTQYTK